MKFKKKDSILLKLQKRRADKAANWEASSQAVHLAQCES